MAHVMSLIFFPMLIDFMSNFSIKKGSCHPVEFKGQMLFGPTILSSPSEIIQELYELMISINQGISWYKVGKHV